MDLKIKDVAELLNVSETTIRRWLADGKIPAYRLHHQYRFNRGEIENWVLSQKVHSHPHETTVPRATKAKSGGLKQFSLYRAIHKGGVFDGIKGETKEDIIRMTMRKIAGTLHLDADVLSDLLLDRENLQPTALGNGIGIPHTRDFLLKAHQDVVVIAFPDEPIPYGALDGKPVHTLFFLFASNDRHHLHLLAKIAHFSNQPETIDFLRTRPTQSVLLEYIKNWESSILHVASDEEEESREMLQSV